jgi:hypothetical protein
MSSVIEASAQSIARAPRSDFLADLLSELSQQLLHAAQLQTSVAANAGEQDSHDTTANVLQRLLEAQREAAVLCSTDGSEIPSA